MNPWVHEDHKMWRWCPRFALVPVRTLDAGWIWLRRYWVYEAIYGWGFHDKHPYLSKDGRERFR